MEAVCRNSVAGTCYFKWEYICLHVPCAVDIDKIVVKEYYSYLMLEALYLIHKKFNLYG
jgi:hypothetical protein